VEDFGHQVNLMLAESCFVAMGDFEDALKAIASAWEPSKKLMVLRRLRGRLPIDYRFDRNDGAEESAP
jgi:hypothetical protein